MTYSKNALQLCSPHRAQLRDRGIVRRPDDVQRTFQIGCHVAVDNTARDREPGHLTSDLLGAVRRFVDIARASIRRKHTTARRSLATT